MLISVEIKKKIEKEAKTQRTLLKLLENQEKNYNMDLTQEKEDINKSIDYYDKVLKEVA